MSIVCHTVDNDSSSMYSREKKSSTCALKNKIKIKNKIKRDTQINHKIFIIIQIKSNDILATFFSHLLQSYVNKYIKIYSHHNCICGEDSIFF